MRTPALASVLVALVGSLSASAAVVTYSISALSDNGTVASGSVSWDSNVIGANYNSTSAETDLISFSLSLTSIPQGPGTASFVKGVDTSTFFQITTDGSGHVTAFSPDYNASGGYRLFALGGNSSRLRSSPGNLTVDTLDFTLTQVPEVGTTALCAAAGLGGFALLRNASRRRASRL